jgi:hypothetical protein
MDRKGGASRPFCFLANLFLFFERIDVGRTDFRYVRLFPPFRFVADISVRRMTATKDAEASFHFPCVG